MASAKERDVQEFKENSMFVARFVYDVLVYTLTKCGFPETSLPTTNCAENVYLRTDFLKIAGVSVLRIALVMRDKWKRMFKSRHNSSGFSNKDILELVTKLAKCCRSSRSCRTQSLVELLLASCNEIMMYLQLENINIHVNNLIKLISAYVVGATGLNRNDPEKLEELFDSFDDISGYTEWITDFITRFAIPYGARDDVSHLFFEGVREQFKVSKSQTDSLRFLPHDLFLAITDGRSEKLSKSVSKPSEKQSLETSNLHMGSEIGAMGGVTSLGNLSTCTENISKLLLQSKQSSLLELSVTAEGSESTTKSISTSSDREAPEPQKLPTGSEIGAVGRKETVRSLPTCIENVSEHLAENKQSSEVSLEVGIEQDIEETSLDAEEASH